MPDTIVIKHQTVDEAIEEFGDNLQEDEDAPHVVSFAEADELSRLLTERRMEIIEAIMTEEPDSIRDLADKVDHGLREVHEDVQMLASRGIVEFEEDGRAKKPRIPYDNVRIEVDLPRNREPATV